LIWVLALSKFSFKFLNEAGKSTKLKVFRVGFKHLRVIEGKESQYFSILLILFRGVVSRDKLKESVDDLGVKYEGLDIFFSKKAVKGDVESTRRFHDNDCVSEGFKKVKELREALNGHGKFTEGKDLAVFCKDTEMEIILRYVNTYIMTHNATSLFSRFLSLTRSSPVAGALVAQPTYWELRDRGTYSFGGLIAYSPWSPCPSLSYKPEKVSLRDILYRIYCRRKPVNLTLLYPKYTELRKANPEFARRNVISLYENTRNISRVAKILKATRRTVRKIIRRFKEHKDH